MELTVILNQGDCRIYKVSSDGYVGFCERASAPDKPEGVIFTIITDEVDAWYEKLTAKGVEYETPPSLNEKYNIYHSFLRDPNGYLLEIQRFEDGKLP